MEEQVSIIRKIARTNALVLLLGASGTGKEILARAVHAYSPRADKPFLPVNCAAVPGHLLESTLFGYKRGAFTGADADNPGLIRAAAGGTLFLDGIGELGLELQPKLLRFLESGEIAPLGELTTTKVDVRIVCATNQNLAELVQLGAFREDLYYRINVVRLEMNPLRERRDEIPGLVNHFVAAASKEFGKGYLVVAEEAMERLLLYRWPGNIRQLQNEVRRMVALVEAGGTLTPDLISHEILDALPLVRPEPSRGIEIAVSIDENLPSTVERVEREMIKAALRAYNGRVDAVAKALGISRKGLYLKRQRLGL
jgi:transcriptional regulator with PAS, ATPase and Fis domain